jgi:AcrR family transcriptional regulator
MAIAAISRKTHQSAKTREALLTTCLALFAERGFANTSIDEIARAAGVTKGAMYWHFESKDHLFQAILERIRSRWQEVVHRPVSARRAPLERLAQLFDSYAELFQESPEVCLFLQQVLLDQHHPQFSSQVAKVFSATARFVAGILDAGKRAGVMRRDLESRPAAHMILGMLAGASQQAATAPGLTLRRLLVEAKAMTLAHVTR